MPVELWNSAGCLVVICIELWMLTTAFSCFLEYAVEQIFFLAALATVALGTFCKVFLIFCSKVHPTEITLSLMLSSFGLLNIGFTTATGNISDFSEELCTRTLKCPFLSLKFLFFPRSNFLTLYSRDLCRSLKSFSFPSALFASESSLSCLLLQMTKNRKAGVVCGKRKLV